MKLRSISSFLTFIIGIYTVNSLDLENEIDHRHASDQNHPNLKLPASEMPLELDILKLINVSSKDHGVSLVKGPIKTFPAYKFRLLYGNLPLDNSSLITSSMNNTRGFTVIFLYRQQKNNLGTLLSLHSPGRLTPWFQLISNSKTGVLTLKYRLRNSNKLNQIDWGIPHHHKKSLLAAWIWVALSMDFQDDLIRLDLNCVPSLFEPINLKKGSLLRVGIPQDTLVYFQQEPGRKKRFLGSMQVAKILPYVTQNRLWNCMDVAEYQKPRLV